MAESPKVFIEATKSSYLEGLGVDLTRASKQLSVSAFVAYSIASMGVPAVLSGTQIGNVVYPGDHAFVYGYNMFGDTMMEDQRNEREPVLVAIVQDGSVFDYRNSKPQGDVVVVSRVDILGVTKAVAQDCSWLLHKVFSQRPVFTRMLCVDGGNNKADLIVRGTRPIDEPAVAESIAGSRVYMTFRIATTHSRV